MVTTTPPPELLALSERATQGEWTLANYDDYNDFDGHSRVIIGDDRRIGVIQVQSADDEEDNANAELSVAAVNWLRTQDWTTTPTPELPESVVTELLELPEPLFCDPGINSGIVSPLFTEDQLRTYAAESVRAANARAEGLEADAARWRAVIGCARIRLLGSAGLHSENDPYGNPHGTYGHIGLELWTQHDAGSYPEAVADFIKFADKAVAAQAVRSEASEGEG